MAEAKNFEGLKEQKKLFSKVKGICLAGKGYKRAC
jgi:hypothetical protein